MIKKILLLAASLLMAHAHAQTDTKQAKTNVSPATRSNTVDRVFNNCYVDGTTYTTIASAYGDARSCKMVTVPAGYTEKLSANLVLNRSSVPIFFEGPATLNLGLFQITKPGTANSTFFGAPNCFSGSGAGQCVAINYSGRAQAIVVGDSKTHSSGLYLHGLMINTSGDGASCLQLNNIDEFEISGTKCTANGGASPIGIITNGTGEFVGVGKFDNVHVVMRGKNSIGYQFQELSSHIQILGGNLDLDAGTSAVCFDVQGPTTSSIELMNPNANTCNTAVKVESSATGTGAIFGTLRIDSGVVSVATFATGTVANKLVCIDCATNAVYTDAGKNNSVEFPILNQVNSKTWSVGASSSETGYFQVQDRTDKIPMIAKQSGAATVVNASAGNPIRFNANSPSAIGAEFWGAGAKVAIIDHDGTFHPAVAGAVGLGTAASPEKQLLIGSSTMKYTLWQPEVTAARTLTTPDGNSSTVMPAHLTTTSSQSDTVTITGMTASGHCSLTPNDAEAARNITATFIGAKAKDHITVSHPAIANMSYDILCTSN
jgi:hypothetical protein